MGTSSTIIEQADDRPAIRGLDLSRVGDVLILRRRVGSRSKALFLAFWLTIWSVGCIGMGMSLFRGHGDFPVILIVPFYAAWIFVSCLEVLMVFGREEVRLGPGGARYQLHALVKLADRSIPLDQLKAIVADEKVPSTDSSEDLWSGVGVTIVTLGRPLKIARGLEEEPRRILAAMLDEHLRSLTPALITEPSTKGKSHREWLPGPALPEGSHLRIEHEYDGFRLTRRYPFSLAAFGLVTFLVAFWNGILSIFVLAAVTKRIWLLLLFLSAHAAIGLFILLNWLWLLVSPFRRRTWTFRPSEIIERYSILGLPWTRYREPPTSARVEFRKSVPTRRRWISWQVDDGPNSDHPPFAVALVDPDGWERIVLKGLTEGEARCLESELRQLYVAQTSRSDVPREMSAVGPLLGSVARWPMRRDRTVEQRGT